MATFCEICLMVGFIILIPTSFSIFDLINSNCQVDRIIYFVNSVALFLVLINGSLLYHHSLYEWDYKPVTVNVVKLDDMSVAKIDGKLLNLNEVFKQNVPEGKIEVLVPIVKRYGLLWADKYKAEEIKLVQ